MNLYEINKDYTNLFFELEQILSIPDKEITQEEIERLKEIDSLLTVNQDNFKEKALNYAMYISSLEGDIEKIDVERKRLLGLKQSKEKLIEKLKTNLVNSMKLLNTDKVDLSTFKLSLRKSESVDTLSFEKHFSNIFLDFKTKFKEMMVSTSEFFKSNEKINDLFDFEIEIKPKKLAIKKAIKETGEDFCCSITESTNLQIK